MAYHNAFFFDSSQENVFPRGHRFTAITCPPTEFADRYHKDKPHYYKDRPQLFSQLSPIKIMISLQLDPKASAHTFVDQWNQIVTAIEDLSSRTGDATAWKRIVVHLHGPMNWDGLREEVQEILHRMGVRGGKSPRFSISGIYGQTPSSGLTEDQEEIHGEKIHCNIYEHTLRLRPYFDPDNDSVKYLFSDPVQIITTVARGPPGTMIWRSVAKAYYHDWTKAVGEVLKPNLMIDMSATHRLHKHKTVSGDTLYDSWGADPDHDDKDGGFIFACVIKLLTLLIYLEDLMKRSPNTGPK